MDYNNTPLVSIVVPIYNTEKYLNECIKSLCNQTYLPLEIVLVDDGSTDSSSRICDVFSSQKSYIKVIHTRNQGRTRARITGVKQALGEYVVFVDADDHVAPTYVEHLVNCYFKYKVDMSCCQCYHDFGNQKSAVIRSEHGRFDREEIKRILSSNFLFDDRTGFASIPHYLCCKLIKKSTLLEVLPLGVDLWYGEDAVAVFSLLWKSDSIYTSKEPLYYYRQHSSQTNKKMDRERWDIQLKLYQTLDSIDYGRYLTTQLPLFILAHLRDWLKVRYSVSNSFGEFKSDMVYALNNETMEKYFMHKHIATSNKRHRILAFLAQQKMYYPYYMFLKVHLATLRFRG